MSNPVKRWILAAGVGGSLLVGGALGASVFSTAPALGQTDASTPAASQPADDATRPPRDPSKGGHMRNGVTEALLTGDTAAKVTEAAKAAVPDGTVERVENDAEGDPYEAHMVKADGSHVSVKIGADFKVIRIEEGHGPGGRGPRAQEDDADDTTLS